ncbi:MAG: ComF family protein [Blautia sp.]|jgi:ComF family protein
MDLLNFLYPRRCPICHGILRNSKWTVCPDCVPKLRPIREPRCQSCGKALRDQEQELCADCAKGSHLFDRGLGIFPYNRLAHASVMKYKNGGRQEYERFYIQAASLYGAAWVRRFRPQVLVPIPMREVDRRKRGFCPSVNLARGLGQAWGIPVEERLLYKVKKTKAQKGLEAAKRRENVRGAYAGAPGIWPYRRILLIDDVYTTGSTIDAAAQAAAAHGVEEIYFLTVFIGDGY